MRIMTSMQQPFSWESLIPTSFKNSLYIRSLKISVTAGSFVRYSAVEASPPNVGRILEVVTSMNMIPDHENQPLLHLVASLSEGQFEDDQPVQYAKVNIFKDRESFPADCNFPEGSDRFDRWQRIVQLGKCEWIPSYFTIGLAFVAIEDDGFFDDCHGMCYFFLVKYRIAENGTVSIIPRRACPPFPGQIESFRRIWSVDYCELVLNSIRHIRQEMQRILCRVAQSQGNFDFILRVVGAGR